MCGVECLFLQLWEFLHLKISGFLWQISFVDNCWADAEGIASLGKVLQIVKTPKV